MTNDLFPTTPQDFYTQVVPSESEPDRLLQSSVPEDWWLALRSFLISESKSISDLIVFLRNERKDFTVFPKASDTFRCFHKTPVASVKVVILGQDPYPSRGYANGLAFSKSLSTSHLKDPASLTSIYTELQNDLGDGFHFWGEHQAKQGVLLLNTALTVREGLPNSHKSYWDFFTRSVIMSLVTGDKPIVFLLWGNNAIDSYSRALKRVQDFYRFLPINPNLHVLKTTHPSPLSCNRGFLGSKPFSSCNLILQDHGLSPIDW